MRSLSIGEPTALVKNAHPNAPELPSLTNPICVLYVALSEYASTRGWTELFEATSVLIVKGVFPEPAPSMCS